MTKRIEEVKKGDCFTKWDWTFEVVDITDLLETVYPVRIRFMDASNLGVCTTKSQAEAIDTWIEDTSISQAAADAIMKKIDAVDDWHGTDAWYETRAFIQSLVKK